MNRPPPSRTAPCGGGGVLQQWLRGLQWGSGLRRGKARGGGGMRWPANSGNGLGGPMMGSAGSSTFYLFFYLINQGGPPIATKNGSFTVIFGPRRLLKKPRLIVFARLD